MGTVYHINGDIWETGLVDKIWGQIMPWETDGVWTGAVWNKLAEEGGCNPDCAVHKIESYNVSSFKLET